MALYTVAALMADFPRRGRGGAPDGSRLLYRTRNAYSKPPERRLSASRADDPASFRIPRRLRQRGGGARNDACIFREGRAGPPSGAARNRKRVFSIRADFRGRSLRLLRFRARRRSQRDIRRGSSHIRHTRYPNPHLPQPAAAQTLT